MFVPVLTAPLLAEHLNQPSRYIFEQQTRIAAAQGLLYPPDHPYVRRVRDIGMKIARVAADGAGGGACDHMRGLQWEFAVIKSDQANAFVAPGGKVR